MGFLFALLVIIIAAVLLKIYVLDSPLTGSQGFLLIIIGAIILVALIAILIRNYAVLIVLIIVVIIGLKFLKD